MPYDRRHTVIQWGGTLPGGEIWSNMLRMGPSNTGDSASVPTSDQYESWLHGDVKDAVSEWHQRASSKIHVTCKLTYVKANPVDTTGHYIDPNTHEHVYAPVVSGGSTGTYHPNQICWCVSFTTGLQRGPAHRGRFYSPCPAVQVDAVTGLVDQADAQGVADSAALFIQKLSDTPLELPLGGFPFSYNVLVMSNRSATHPITGVEVGRVLDTQQRRRRELAENYVSHVVDQGIL